MNHKTVLSWESNYNNKLVIDSVVSTFCNLPSQVWLHHIPSSSLSEIYSLNIWGGSVVGYIYILPKKCANRFHRIFVATLSFTGQSTDYVRIRVKQQQRRGKRGQKVSQTQQIFGCILTDQNIFLAAKNDGGDRGAGPGHYLTLDKTLDTTGHTTAGDTDDNTGTGWLHSQNILHLTFVGLVLICK